MIAAAAGLLAAAAAAWGVRSGVARSGGGRARAALAGLRRRGEALLDGGGPGQAGAAGAVGVVLGLLAGLLAGPALGLLLGPIAAAAVPAWATSRARRRRLRLARQLAGALEGLGAAVRAGLALPAALGEVATRAEPPLGPLLSASVELLRLGRTPEDALAELARRVDTEEADLVTSAVAVARRTGGNLATALEGIAGTLQARLELEGRLQALTSAGRLQGWVLAALPLGLGLAYHLLRPDLTGPFLAHPAGRWLSAGMAVALVAGLRGVDRIAHRLEV